MIAQPDPFRLTDRGDMSTTLPSTPQVREIAGIPLEIVERGTGKPLLFLHGAGGPRANAPFIDLLARHARVIAPSHPGFGNSPLPDWLDGVEDLAYLYLDLLDQDDLRDVTLVGASMGGWTAAAIAIKCAHRLARVILVDPVGIKISDRETRDIPDIYALPPDEVARLTYHDPNNAPNYAALSDDELLVVAKNREAAVLYLWEPYMHDPALRRRLHRISVPTLVLRGESDGLVSDAYARAYAAAIPGARYEVIAKAGHSPQTEQPQAFVDHVLRFMGS
jgi:pimeloyl-ACP methyl ester carboxylesterase